MYDCRVILPPSSERLLPPGPPASAPRVQQHLPKTNRRQPLKPRKIAQWFLHGPRSLTKHAAMAGLVFGLFSFLFFSFLFFSFLKLPNRQGRRSTVVDLQACLHFFFLTSKHPGYQCSFPPTVLFSTVQRPNASTRFLLHITLMSQQKIPSRPQWDEMKMPHLSAPSFINFTHM